MNRQNRDRLNKQDEAVVHTLNTPLAFHLTRTYRVWVGDHGYDTRPFLNVKDAYAGTPPVAYELEFASRHHQDRNHTREAGDVLGWMDRLPVGAVIFIPEYSGYKHVGNYVWRVEEGRSAPVPLGYEDYRAQATITPEGEYIFWEWDAEFFCA